MFLGAGASKPLGKMLMGEFVQELRSRISGERYSELVGAICEKSPDLEFLIEQLEEIASKQYLGDVHTRRRGDGEVFSLPAVSSELAAVAKLASSALQRVKREVYLHYRGLEASAKVGLLEGLIDSIGATPGCIVAFTTNYDPSVETLCRGKGWRLVDGFKHNSQLREDSWNRSVFDKFASTQEPTIVLFKIHGSTDWVMHAGRLIRSLPVLAAEAEDSYQNAMIYPATRKVAIAEPYFTCYDYLGKCLAHAEFCFAVGYSFRDYDVLMRFRAAAISNEQLQIAILDPCAQKICDGIKKYGINALPIVGALGEDSESYRSEISDVLSGRAKF